MDQFQDQHFGYVVTLCDDVRDVCPAFPGTARQVHVGFPDPAQATGTPEAVLQEYRRIRDLIGKFVAGLPDTLSKVAESEN